MLLYSNLLLADIMEISSYQVQQQQISSQCLEGGRQAWLVVVGTWYTIIPFIGLFNSLKTLHAWISSYQLKDYSKSSISQIFKVYNFFLYIIDTQARLIFNYYRPAYIVIPSLIRIIISLLYFSFSLDKLYLYSKILLTSRILLNLSFFLISLVVFQYVSFLIQLFQLLATSLTIIIGWLLVLYILQEAWEV